MTTSVRDEFRQVPVEVFDEFGDVVITGKLTEATVDYSPGGEATKTGTIAHQVRLIEAEITDGQLEAGIALASDRLFLTPAAELSITPKPKMELVVEGVKYIVEWARADPARAMWSLLAR